MESAEEFPELPESEPGPVTELLLGIPDADALLLPWLFCPEDDAGPLGGDR